jgi:hypothetical protein
MSTEISPTLSQKSEPFASQRQDAVNPFTKSADSNPGKKSSSNMDGDFGSDEWGKSFSHCGCSLSIQSKTAIFYKIGDILRQASCGRNFAFSKTIYETFIFYMPFGFCVLQVRQIPSGRRDNIFFEHNISHTHQQK